MSELNVDIMKQFIAKSKCGRCGQHYEIPNIEALGHHEDLWLFTAYCSPCNSLGLVLVNVKRDKEPEIVNEAHCNDTAIVKPECNDPAIAEPAEEVESRFSVPVSSSDVLDMYIFLKDFDGDFASLFAIYS